MVMLPTTSTKWTQSVIRVFPGVLGWLRNVSWYWAEENSLSPLWNIFGWSQCCFFAIKHKGMCWQRLKGGCGFGQSGFETVVLPWKLEGSRIKLAQGTDDTGCPLLCSQTCEPAQRTGWEIGGDKQRSV